jgi:hypothetical protein
MQQKPWTEIATPHADVLKGTFQDAEFAADLSRVQQGKAGPEYGDPVRFFERTYITEGMRLLLDGVVRRLDGRGGDPVVQLQTAFGGGKTHTLLAVYHLAQGKASPTDMRGIPKILDEAGISELPKARIAVIDGNRLAPSQPKKIGKLTIHTLWGEIAFQLGKEVGYQMVAESDAKGTSPGKEILISLLTESAPCVLLVDELVSYFRQFQEGQTYSGGTFDSNISFINALTEAVTAVPQAVLLASLPESETEVGSTMGKKSLAALEKFFGRIQALWKPVATEEAFEIVRRRLFNPISDTQSMEAVCSDFAKMYTEKAEAFPLETHESSYLQRLINSYPIHPEIFTRLYEDWSSLDGFQRTRGVLKLMAKVIYRLWKDGNRDLMIMPGSLPYYDSNVKNDSIYYLPQGWDPVMDKDVDGENAQSTGIDTQDPRLGSAQAARRVARTIFLGSAPSVRDQMIRGIDIQRINLGAVQPGIPVSSFGDALKRLSDKLHYLNSADGRYWFDVRPNLRREMEERKRRFENRANEVNPEIRSRLTRLLNRGCFGGIHVFTPANDISDDFELRLCVISPEKPHSKKGGLARGEAEQVLKTRGNQPRQHQNRLIFLAADEDSIGHLRDQVKTYLAWKSIKDDVDNLKLVLDVLQIEQVKKQLAGIDGSLNRTVSECYRWLLCPHQTIKKDGTPDKLSWEGVTLNGSSKSMIQEIEDKLLAEEMIIDQWSPIHLSELLNKWFWSKGRSDIGTQSLWQAMCDYLYMPRLVTVNTLQRVICDGAESGDYFGYADGKDEGQYKGLKLGKRPYAVIDERSLLIEFETAKAARAAHDDAACSSDTEAESKGSSPEDSSGVKASSGEGSDTDTLPAEKKTRYFGTVQLDPHTGRIAFDQIHDEVIKLFSGKPGVSVTVRLDITAEFPDGFDENLQRAARENSAALDFDESEFN